MQGQGYKLQSSKNHPPETYNSGGHGQHGSRGVEQQPYATQYSERGSHSELSSYTLPHGTASPSVPHPGQSATLEQGAKPPVAAKPDKKKHGFFSGGLFSKSKKDKERDAKK